MDRKKIVVVPFNAVGHVNGCHGATFTSLLSRGHHVYFVLEKAFKGQLEPFGFEEIIYEIPSENDSEKSQEKKPGEQMANELLSHNVLGQLNLEQKIRYMLDYFTKSTSLRLFFEQVDHCLRKLMERIEVDLFIIDDAYSHPAIFYSNVPLIRCVTSSPFLFFNHDSDLPPAFTGLPSNSDPKEKEKFRNLVMKLFDADHYDEFWKKLGYKDYPSDRKVLQNRASMTIYAYPKELNHWKIESASDWFNLEVFNKNPNQQTVDLEKLVGSEFFKEDFNGSFSGKWIYVSLGSMGSIDLNLMRRLIATLEQTNHKYIVSKGPRHEEYDLPANMWGSRFVPQIRILPIVDLVITHGGNNTVTETFAQGKPMIVMPLFCDQLDNAQRLLETNFGIRIEPYSFHAKDLLDSIERLLNDQNLAKRLAQASKRIQESRAHQVFGEKAEEIMKHKSS